MRLLDTVENARHRNVDIAHTAEDRVVQRILNSAR
jgi:hypothetical protein